MKVNVDQVPNMSEFTRMAHLAVRFKMIILVFTAPSERQWLFERVLLLLALGVFWSTIHHGYGDQRLNMDACCSIDARYQ